MLPYSRPKGVHWGPFHAASDRGHADGFHNPCAGHGAVHQLGIVAFAHTGSAGQALTTLEKAIFSSMIPALASITPKCAVPRFRGDGTRATTNREPQILS